MKPIHVWAVLAGVGSGVAGCGIGSPTPPTLEGSQFVRSRPAVGHDPIPQPVDRSGALAFGDLHAPLLPDEYDAQPSPPPVQVSPIVRQSVPAPGEGAGASVTPARVTPPDTAPGGGGGAQTYEVVGTVLATVKGRAIYADKVLASLDRELAAEARKYDPSQFKLVAREDIAAKVQELIQSELEVTAAEERLNGESRTGADLYAQNWRRQQITAAGGSLELAKQRALDAGTTFEEQVKAQQEKALVQIYYQQRVLPKIQIAASDIRRYYADHQDSEFTQHAAARFRLIKIDFERSGGKERAAEKINDVLRQLRGGGDFTELAKKYNDLPDAGEMGWVNKGDFAIEDVERAVWALHPGEYTDKPIESINPQTGVGAFYLALLEARKLGLVKPFSDPAVQQAIQDKLFKEQFASLRMQELGDLIKNAVILRDPHGLDIAVEMAMQRYPLWASAR